MKTKEELDRIRKAMYGRSIFIGLVIFIAWFILAGAIGCIFGGIKYAFVHRWTSSFTPYAWGFFLAAFAVIWLLNRCIISIPSNHVGIEHNEGWTVEDSETGLSVMRVLASGFYLIPPTSTIKLLIPLTVFENLKLTGTAKFKDKTEVSYDGGVVGRRPNLRTIVNLVGAGATIAEAIKKADEQQNAWFNKKIQAFAANANLDETIAGGYANLAKAIKDAIEDGRRTKVDPCPEDPWGMIVSSFEPPDVKRSVQRVARDEALLDAGSVRDIALAITTVPAVKDKNGNVIEKEKPSALAGVRPDLLLSLSANLLKEGKGGNAIIPIGGGKGGKGGKSGGGAIIT